MTRSRAFGEDTPFSHWLRTNENMPSTKIVATDADMIIHRYMTVVDSEGTRDIQSIMTLEVKTRGGSPSSSQADTLFKVHRSSYTPRLIQVNGELVKNWGVSILSMAGTSPDNSEWLVWGRFLEDGSIDWGDKFGDRYIDLDTLEKLLSFEIGPDDRRSNPLRRHHKTRTIIQRQRQALPFCIDVTLKTRS